MKKIMLAALCVVIFSLAATRAAFWLAAASAPGPSSVQGCAVLVLGYPTNADGTVSPVERFRVEAGVKVYREYQCGKLVLSGAAVRNEHVEAESMAKLAKSLGVPDESIVLERSARSTWENVGCTARLLPFKDRVLVVSDSLHAKRAVRYACRQDPRLCERFVAAGVAPPADAFWSDAAAANELRVFVRDFLFYRSGAVANSATCSSQEEEPLQVGPSR